MRYRSRHEDPNVTAQESQEIAPVLARFTCNSGNIAAMASERRHETLPFKGIGLFPSILPIQALLGAIFFSIP